MYKWEKRQQGLADIRKAEQEGRVADNLDVRVDLIRRMNNGEINLAEVQAQLRKLKREAKKHGQITRIQAYRGR